MAVSVEKWIDEPIIILTPDAHVSEQELIDAWLHSAELASDGVKRIVDLRAASSPDWIVSTIRNIAQAASGAPVSPRLKVIFVGAAPTTETWFTTLNEALESTTSAEEMMSMS